MKETRLPKVGEFVRGHGTLVGVETIPPPPAPPPKQDYIFEEITARGEMRRNGKVIHIFSTLNDFYGIETGVKTCIEEMQGTAAADGITTESEVELVVVRIARQFRMRPCNKENFYDKTFPDFERLDRGSEWNLPAPVETVAWSSKNAPKVEK